MHRKSQQQQQPQVSDQKLPEEMTEQEKHGAVCTIERYRQTGAVTRACPGCAGYDVMDGILNHTNKCKKPIYCWYCGISDCQRVGHQLQCIFAPDEKKTKVITISAMRNQLIKFLAPTHDVLSKILDSTAKIPSVLSRTITEYCIDNTFVCTGNESISGCNLSDASLEASILHITSSDSNTCTLCITCLDIYLGRWDQYRVNTWVISLAADMVRRE